MSPDCFSNPAANQTIETFKFVNFQMELGFIESVPEVISADSRVSLRGQRVEILGRFKPKRKIRGSVNPARPSRRPHFKEQSIIDRNPHQANSQNPNSQSQNHD